VNTVSETARAAFRSIGIGLDGAIDGQTRIVVISSPRPSDGTSFVAAHIAYELAAMRRRVLLVDAALRNPTQHATFGVAGSPGVAELLEDVRTERAAQLVRVTRSGVAVLSAGAARQSAGLCAVETARRFADVVRALGYRLAIVDAPPVLTSPEALVLCRIADETLLTVRSSVTRERDVRDALELLRRQGASATGVILNDYREVGRGRPVVRPAEPSALTSDTGDRRDSLADTDRELNIGAVQRA
jgi:tyrosine-protein kinase Etk/Wzc